MGTVPFSRSAGFVLKALLAADPTLDVFLVLEANNEFETGTSG